jgi:release factor glutamine methyltransferase
VVTTGPDRTTASGGNRTDLVAEVAGRVGSLREAVWIVEHVETVLGVGSPGVRATSVDLATRRAEGEPLQYVLGTWPFRSVDLYVDRRVLIPRPETEQVVEVALEVLGRLAASRRSGDGEDAGALVCVDLGTGSGAIALSLAVEGADVGLPLVVWAADVSSDALDVARSNLDRLAERDPAAAGRVSLVEGSWFGALPDRLAGRVDLVVSNPPYVARDEFADLEPTVREWEPRGALVSDRGRGGVAGMADIEEVVSGAGAWLRRDGGLVVELAPPQADAAAAAARRAGFATVGTARDLAGRTRMLVAER